MNGKLNYEEEPGALIMLARITGDAEEAIMQFYPEN